MGHRKGDKFKAKGHFYDAAAHLAEASYESAKKLAHEAKECKQKIIGKMSSYVSATKDPLVTYLNEQMEEAEPFVK